MGGSINSGGGGGGRRRRGAGRHRPLSEINVTPFVDVMLVLLIIFMVAAPLLTVGVPIDLPQSKGKQLDANQEPLQVIVSAKGDVFIGETPVPIGELAAKLKAIAQARGGADEPIWVRGDRGINYGTVMRVMGELSGSGFKKLNMVTEAEDRK